MPNEAQLGRGLQIMNLGLWTLFYGLFILLLALEGSGTWATFAAMVLGIAVGASLSAVIAAVVTRTEGLPLARRLIIVSSVLTALALLNSVVDAATLGRVMARGREFGGWRFFLQSFQSFTFLFWIHAFYGACVWLVRTSLSLVEKQRRLALAEAETQKAVLAALRLQINPHFLFNALNATASLIGAGRNREAEEVVVRLSEFFRASLVLDPERATTLAEEFEVLETYLQIETVRFSDRMTVEVDFPPELETALIPSLLLQPIAENAVKHAVATSTAPVHVQVTASRADRDIIITVSDDGPPCTVQAPGAGVGLANVRDRLTTLFGDSAEVTAGRSDAGFTTIVRFPLSLAGAAPS